MDTLVTIAVSADVADDVSLGDKVTIAQNEILRLEALWSRFNPESEITRINNAAGRGPVAVSPETAEVIRTCIEYSQLSGGAFDIVSSAGSRGPLHRNITSPLVVDMTTNQITLSRGGTKIDLGGIGKGAAADKAAEVLLREGISGLLINMGGNVLVRGCRNGCRDNSAGGKQNSPTWRIGIRDPWGGPSDTFGFIEIEEGSVSTSAHYERKRHIRDPRTGRPVKNDLVSVSVIAPTAAEADALSTAAFVLGKEEGITLLSSLPSRGGVFITRSGEVECAGCAENVFTSPSLF
jgi:thiamine biosynthesis lipoprotein